MKSKISLKITAGIIMLLSLITAAFRYVLLINHIDPSNGLYTSQVLGNVFFGAVCFIVVLALLTYFYVKKADVKSPIKEKSVGCAIASALCILSFAALFFTEIFNLAAGVGKPDILMIAALVLCIPSVISFLNVFFVSIGKSKFSNLALLPAFPPLYVAVRTISLFIDTSTQINASQRSFELLTMVFAMMFLVTEASYSVRMRPDEDAEKNKKNRDARYFVCAVITAALALIVTATYLLAVLTGKYEAGYDTCDHVLTLCFGIYAAVRAFELG